MKFAITEIFCEILTGLFAGFVVLTWLDWLQTVTFEQVWQTVKPLLGLPTLTGVFIAAYLLGIVLDAVGLVFENVFCNIICVDEPSADQIKSFWKNAGGHVVAYRDNVWAFYFCYLNLFMLMLPAIVALFGTLWRRGYPGWAWIITIILIGTEIILFSSMRTLLKLYYNITKSFEPEVGP